jgi:hypothetical protein
MDRYGRTILFNYYTNAIFSRLTCVVDVDGRTNRLYYTNSAYPRLVTSIISPYGQTAHLSCPLEWLKPVHAGHPHHNRCREHSSGGLGSAP